MSTSKTWPGGGTNTTPASYSIPDAGELNWQSLSNFLLALGDSAQATTFQKFAINKATSSPVAVSATTDCVVVTDLTVAGAVTVNLPAGANKQVFVIIDGKGDAGTNNITINRNGSDTIKGSTTLVLDHNRQAVLLVYNAADTDWKVLGPVLFPGTITSSDIAGSIDATKIGAGSVDNTEFGYLNGVTSALQTQLDNKQPLDADLTALAALASNGLIARTGAGTVAARTITAGSSKLSVSDGDGVAGNPTLDVAESNLTLDNIGGTLGVAKGGTGITSGTSGGVPYYSAGTTIASSGALTASGVVLGGGAGAAPTTTAAGAANQVLRVPGGGGAPAFGAVDLTQAAAVTGALPIGNGGSGQTTANAALNAFLPSQASNTGRFLKTDGTNTSWGDAGSSGGSGGVNVITNPSAVSDTTGWTDDANHTNTRVTSGSPLDPVVTTAFSFEATSSTAESSTSGVYWSVGTMPEALRDKKLKVEFYVDVPSSDVWRLSVYQSTTRLALSTDSSSVTTLPAGFNGKFTTYVDTTTATAYSVNFTKTTHTGANPLVVTQVVFGDGTQPQGAVVGEWQSYTPVLTTSGDASDITSNVTKTGKYQRIGSSLHGMVTLDFTGTPAITGGAWRIGLPGSLTIDASYFPTASASGNPVGTGRLRDNGGAQDYTATAVWFSTVPNVIHAVINQSTTSTVSNTSPFTFSTSDKLSIEFTVPIAEWAGSGTVNVAQNDLEYASVGGTWDAASSTTIYGSSGAAIGGALTAARVKTITWQTPVQATDRIQIWLSKDRITWVPAIGAHIGPSNTPVLNSMDSTGSAATTGSGIYWRPGSTSTQTEIQFARYANIANDDSPVTDWPSSDAYWVATKAKSGQAVGFGEASTTSLGLVKPSFSAYGASQVSFSSASGLVRSGTYTPTSAATLNLDAAPTVTANHMIWSQTGKVVQVSGYVAVNATAIGAAAFTLTLPVVPTANFSGDFEAAGMCAFFTSGLGTQAEVGSVNSTNGAKTVTIGFYASDTSASRNLWYQFQYVTN